jgi:D-sedoheptulose 7-phosphate isomerase
VTRAQLLRERLQEAVEVCEALLADETVAAAVDATVDAIVGALRGGNKVIFCGNGGSAADAQHLAAELVGRFALEREPLPGIALADNVAAMTAIANDYAYTEVFARAVRGLGSPGDVLFALSTSGKSANVIEALAAAREKGIVTVAFVGPPGSPMEAEADHVLRVAGPGTARIQEGQMVLAHTILEIVEREVAGE